MVEIDSLKTSSQVAAHLRSKGLNIIPIAPGTKMPPKGFALKDYFEKKCDYTITDDMSIALLHGKISGTFAVDVDMKNGADWKEAISLIAADEEKILSRTMVIKTPKQGVHFILSPMDGMFPPKNAKYFNKEGIEIDIKTQGGYTLLPPSLHPEKQFGRYQFISDTLDTNITNWNAFEEYLARKGFFLKEDMDRGIQNDYDITSLLAGGYTRGNRRKSQNSLYCKLRVKGKSVEEAVAKIHEINRKLSEPLDKSEVDHNLNYSESFFSTVVLPKLEKEVPLITSQNRKSEDQKQEKNKNNPYTMAHEIMKKYKFISHLSGEIYYYSEGVYHPNGEQLIRTKSRQLWESIGIETKHISEIVNIIQDKTRILSDEHEGDIFDVDYTKITLKNGIYDIGEMKFGPHDSDIISLSKHPIFYDDIAQCPKFDKFLSSCFDGDEKVISQVWEMMALCFIKKTIIQKGYVNYGIGSNGKSTLLNILTSMVGPRNIASIPMQDFQKTQFIGFELRGKGAVISADGGTEPINKTGLIKSILGGDYLKCEEKFKSPFLFLPYCTLIFTFNELPPVNDSSDGFARKIQTIHWHKRFYGNNKDHTVDKLAYDGAEKSGIFNKLIPIMGRLITEKKLSFESTVEETKEIWLSRSDSFFRFKKEKITLGAKYRIPINIVKEKYSKFCEENGMTPLRERALFTKISEMLGGVKPFPTTWEGERNVSVWSGFTLDSELRKDNQVEIQ